MEETILFKEYYKFISKKRDYPTATVSKQEEKLFFSKTKLRKIHFPTRCAIWEWTDKKYEPIAQGLIVYKDLCE
jgi:hypothetical protein